MKNGMTKIGSRIKMTNKLKPMLCDHANEVPFKCKCPKNCYCKTHTCKPTSKELKPNGMPMNTFLISIDDGWVEYRYKLNGCKNESICTMYEKIRRIFKSRKDNGEIRTFKGKPYKNSGRIKDG